MTDSLGTILTAMVTPFDADLRVDHRRLADLARFLIANGSDGLVVAGTTGESPTLTDDEKIAMAKTVLEAVGDRRPVVVGTGSNDTAHSIRLTQLAERAGAHAALVVTPYYNKPPERGIIEHFRAVAGETSLPIIIYNIPGRCVVNLSPEALATLSEVENIVAVKEASGNLSQIAQIVEGAPDGFDVLSGDDEMTLPLMGLGGTGVISTIGNVAGTRMKALIDAQASGDHTRALRIHLELLPLMKALFMTSNPIMVKKALELRGFPVGGVRLPLVDANAEQTAELKRVMTGVGVLDA